MQFVGLLPFPLNLIPFPVHFEFYSHSHSLPAYSRTQVARTIRQRSYDVDRSYDTTYSQS